MQLHPLDLAVAFAPDVPSDHASAANDPCGFCGVRSGPWQRSCPASASASDASARIAACPLCHLVRHLDRPSIDREATLVWLPETSQAALISFVREIHMELRARGDALHADAIPRLDTPERRRLHYARAFLSERSSAAAGRLGTASPIELGRAIRMLSAASPQERRRLMGGLRLLPSGRVYEDGEDVYPAIVDVWRRPSRTHESLFAGTRPMRRH